MKRTPRLTLNRETLLPLLLHAACAGYAPAETDTPTLCACNHLDLKAERVQLV